MQKADLSYQSSTSQDALNLHLHPRQWDAFESTATEILYGGAAGGGKSHLMRSAAIVWCSAIAGLQVYLFRRIRDDLVKNHMEGPKGFRALLAGWVDAGWCNIVQDEIRFWNGSKIFLCHCKDDNDIYKYQGAEIHVLLIDELTHFTEAMYRFLRIRTRMVGLEPPAEYAGRFPRILCGANPGNVGHLWVKRTFVDYCRAYELKRTPKGEGGMLRQFIPAQLDDNPSMAQDDPGYENRLEGLGSEALVRAMRWGDWSIIEGAFFAEFEERRHVLKPFPIPVDWLRFRAMDWGSASPACVLWCAVVTDDYFLDNIRLPRGSIVVYREWYVSRGGSEPNVGLKLSNEQIAEGIKQREANDPKVAYGVLSPDAFAQRGGPSIAESYARYGVWFREADNKRVPQHGAIGGWDQVRARLQGNADGEPMLYMFETCYDLRRTLPALQHDPDKPEDVRDNCEDHAPEALRYACMSRPFVRSAGLKDKLVPLLAVGPTNEVRFKDLLTPDEMPVRRRLRERI